MSNIPKLTSCGRTMVVAATLAVLTVPSVYAGNKCGDTDACLRAMHESIARRGWLGIEYEDHDGEGLPEILQVFEGSPAAKGGMQPGDRLLSINGVSYGSPREEIYAEVKKSLTPGNDVRFEVRRGAEVVELTVTAGQVPDDIAAQWIGRHMVEYHLSDEDGASEKDSEDKESND